MHQLKYLRDLSLVPLWYYSTSPKWTVKASQSPFRDGTEGQCRKNTFWFGKIPSTSSVVLYTSQEESLQWVFISSWTVADGLPRCDVDLKLARMEACWQGKLRQDKVDGPPERTQICVLYELVLEWPQWQQSLLITTWTGLHLSFLPMWCLLSGFMSEHRGNDRGLKKLSLPGQCGWVFTPGQHSLCQQHWSILSLCFVTIPCRTQVVIKYQGNYTGTFPLLKAQCPALAGTDTFSGFGLGWRLWSFALLTTTLCTFMNALYLTTTLYIIPLRSHFTEKEVIRQASWCQ